MLPAWVHNYIGIPYADGGRDRLGIDCYGLARLVSEEVFGHVLPDLSPETIEREGKAAVLACERVKQRWATETSPRPGSLVLMRCGTFSAHVGVCIGGPMFLHVLEGTAVCVESLESPVWKNRIAGFYRWKGNAA